MNGDQLELNYIEDEIKELEQKLEAFNQSTKNKIYSLRNKQQTIMRQRCDGLDEPYMRGKLCMFWDSYEDGKAVRIMIRPFHSVVRNSNGIRFYAEDWYTNIDIGHGWKFCKPVELSMLVGRLANGSI